MADSETGYRCPECGDTEEFYADLVVLAGTTRITGDGWDWWDYPNDADLADGASLKCAACGHRGPAGSFRG